MVKTFSNSIVRKSALAASLSLCALGTAGTAEAGIGFHIEDGRVVPNESFAAKVTVLGAAIQSGSTHVPVTLRIDIGGTKYTPFGDDDDTSGGNVNSAVRQGNLDHIPWTVFDADTEIRIRGKSWIPSGNGHSKHMDIDSHSESSYVKVLRNGDIAPNIDGMDGQADVEEFLAGYIDPNTGEVTIGENDVIYLFELGTSNLSSSAADFQDLVVLVTLGKTPGELAGISTDLEALYD